MARDENDESTILAVATDLNNLDAELSDLEFNRMFNHPMDPNNCFIDIQSGSGGTEAQDWAEMLLRMYMRYGDRKGFKVEILEEQSGDVAGIKYATIKVFGDYAFGYLRTETGVHRLVRNSPFDSNNKRHTSFSSVFAFFALF
jgi:peptide chain release factor 2